MGMITLKYKDIVLRALEPSDLDFLYTLENDESVWEISNTNAPYSRHILKKYIENSHQDIYEAKQLRLAITLAVDGRCVGFVDLFDFDPKHKRVGLGILIFNKKDRRKGYAFDAIKAICNYGFTYLNLRQVYANITEDNIGSIALFTKIGFLQTALKKDWIYAQGKFKDECLFQLIKDVL
jgi:diamine N-acetyltransferase